MAGLRTVMVGVGLVLGALGCMWTPLAAQAPAAAAATSVRQIGTVKSIAGSSITLTTDAGQPVMVSVADSARILQLAPGSTDLKTAQVIALGDITVGDRILVTGKAGDAADQLTALRVILMKSSDIAQKRAQQQADWQVHGSGGLVNAVDAATGTLTVTEGAKKVQVKTSSTTIFRRYSGDSVKFEDAVVGTVGQIQAGDQMRVRGAKSDDGTSIQAEEIVSGSFKNLAGTIATVNAADGAITLKDLSTKQMMTVKVTANSDLRRLPERAAAMFAARAQGGAARPAGAAGASTGAQAGAGQGGAGQGGGATAGMGAGGPGGAGRQGAGRQGAGGQGAGGQDAGGAGAGGAGAGEAGGGAGRSAGMDLSQMLAKLPSEAIGDLHVGDAVMIVASQATPGSASVTAVTLLSGVEPILAATPKGSAAMTLSPWNVGGGAPEGGTP